MRVDSDWKDVPESSLEEIWERILAKAKQCSDNRLCNQMNHHLGTKSMAQKAHDMTTTDGIVPEEVDVYIAAYTARDPSKDPRTTKLVIKEVRDSQIATQGSCSLQPILTQVLGDNKGRYVRSKGSHTKKKNVATSAGKYHISALNDLMKRNQELEHTLRDEIEAREQRRDAHFKEEMQEIRDALFSLCTALKVSFSY